VSVSRQQALKELFAEARQGRIKIHANEEAEELLDWAAARDGAKPEKYQAVTFGGDIFVRARYANDVRVLREELIHAGQQRAGLCTDEIQNAELEARSLMIKNRHRWGLINDEVREIADEIRAFRRRERY
jgi:hypothetical protein